MRNDTLERLNIMSNDMLNIMRHDTLKRLDINRHDTLKRLKIMSEELYAKKTENHDMIYKRGWIYLDMICLKD